MLVFWCGSCGSSVCSSSVYRVGLLGGHGFWVLVSPLVILSVFLVSLVSYRCFIMWMFYELHGDVCTCGLSLSLPRVSTVGKPHLVVVAVQGAPPLDGFLDRTFSSSSISESVRGHQLIICLSATRAALGPDGVTQTLQDILDGRWRGMLQSIEMAQSLGRWSNSTNCDSQFAHYVRRIVTQVVVGATSRGGAITAGSP